MTISYSQLGKNGRTGNMMFQIASTIGIAKDNGADAAFPAWPYHRYFSNPLPNGKMNSKVVSEHGYEFSQVETTEDIDLAGYFQSPKYWENHKVDILKQFEFRKDFYDFFKTRHKLSHIFDREVLAIHVRKGDYVGNENYVSLPKEYYTGAIDQYFPDIHKMNILVFSDDVPAAQEMLGHLKNVFFSTDNSEIDDLCMMSQCSHWIIANSSFSWWAAYLGSQNGQGRVVRPAHHFAGPLAERASTVDLYPETWYVYDHDLNMAPYKEMYKSFKNKSVEELHEAGIGVIPVKIETEAPLVQKSESVINKIVKAVTGKSKPKEKKVPKKDAKPK